ncbi:MAG: hypothetical protein LBE05_05725 [Microbacterium sp.]|jgi:hypothetical protein|nr:hypothetical protein [Microbacterium sp.]
MAADEQGNDLDAVGVPITGLAAFAKLETTNVIAKDKMGAKPLALGAAFQMIGLYKQDGGPAAARDAGEAIEFFQKGYSIAGDGTRTVAITAAEMNAAVLELTEGVEPDTNGVVAVSSSLPNNRFILFTVTRYRGGWEKRRQGVAFVSQVEPDQEERGAVEGQKITFTWVEHDLFGGSPYWEWQGIPGPVAP